LHGFNEGGRPSVQGARPIGQNRRVNER